MASSQGPPKTLQPSAKQMINRLHRMNAKAEGEREQKRYTLETRLTILRGTLDSCSATLQRLRSDRTAIDYIAAKNKRDETEAEIQKIVKELDPQTEFERVNEAISAAKSKGAQVEAAEVISYTKTARAATKKHEHSPTAVDHPREWNGDMETGNVIMRHVTHMGDSDPSLLKLDWTRFDFKPTVPWRSVRQGELTNNVGSANTGMVTYQTKKVLQLERRVLESRERTSPHRTSNNNSRSGSRGGVGGAGASSGSSSAVLATTGGFGGGLPEGSSSNNSGSNNNTTDQQQRHDEWGFSQDTGNNNTTGEMPFHTTTTGTAFLRGRTSTTKLPPIPSHTIARRSIMASTIPERLLDTLSPAQRRVPMHPAYQLDSKLRHVNPWRKPGNKSNLFSKLPRNKAATQNEILRAKEFTVPDRETYNPANDGKRPWLKPEKNAIPLFSHLPLDGEWLSIHGRVEAEELEERFYAAIRDNADGGYEGEDAFSSSSNNNSTMGGGMNAATSQSSTLNKNNNNNNNKGGASAASPSNNVKLPPGSATAMLSRLHSSPTNTRSLSPSLARRAEYDTRKAELATRHSLGIKAFAEAEQQAQNDLVAVTSRMKGKDSRHGMRNSLVGNLG